MGLSDELETKQNERTIVKKSNGKYKDEMEEREDIRDVLREFFAQEKFQRYGFYVSYFNSRNIVGVRLRRGPVKALFWSRTSYRILDRDIKHMLKNDKKMYKYFNMEGKLM